MIYVLRLVTSDEIVCSVDTLDMTSDELVVQDPMEIISGDEGTMYLRSTLMLGDDDYLVIPTSKIVYSYAPSKALVRYYHLAVRMYDEQVRPVINEQVNKSANVIEDAYAEQDEVSDQAAMDLLKGILKKFNKKDLN